MPPRGMAVVVRVAEARGLAAKDKGGTSDPFARVELRRGKGGAIKKESGKTNVVKKSLCPVWDYEVELGKTTQGRAAVLALLVDALADGGATLELGCTVLDEGMGRPELIKFTTLLAVIYI